MAAITLPADPITGKRPRKVVTAATKTEAQRKAGELRKTLQESGDLLTKSLTDAMRRGQVTRNVAELMGPPRKAATERTPLTADETIRFLKVNAREPYVARYALGLMTGCRQGEALRLTCDNVQIDRDSAGNVSGGLVTLAWNLQRVKWRHGCPEKHPCGRKRAAERPKRHVDAEEGPDSHHEGGALWRLCPKMKMSYREVPLSGALAVIPDRNPPPPTRSRRTDSHGDPRPLLGYDDAWIRTSKSHPGVRRHGAGGRDLLPGPPGALCLTPRAHACR